MSFFMHCTRNAVLLQQHHLLCVCMMTWLHSFIGQKLMLTFIFPYEFFTCSCWGELNVLHFPRDAEQVMYSHCHHTQFPIRHPSIQEINRGKVKREMRSTRKPKLTFHILYHFSPTKKLNA